jgi:hypothetical protein
MHWWATADDRKRNHAENRYALMKLTALDWSFHIVLTTIEMRAKARGRGAVIAGGDIDRLELAGLSPTAGDGKPDA